MNARSVGTALAMAAVILLTGLLLPRETAHAGTLERSLYQRSSGSARRAPIQRSPSRRTLRIVSHAVGGLRMPEVHPCWRTPEPLRLPVLGDDSDATPIPVPAPESHVYVSPEQDEAFLNLTGRVYEYNPSLPSGLPFYCATEPFGPDTAYVIPPEPGDTLPAQVTQTGFGAYLVSFPFEVFSQSGTWTLVLDDVERYETRVEIAPFTAPTLLADGDTLLISGFQPGEWVKLLFFDYVRGADRDEGVQAWHDVWQEQGEASLIADDLGSILLERDSQYSIVALGEETSGYVMNVLDSLSWDPAVLWAEGDPDEGRMAVPEIVAPWLLHRFQPGLDLNEVFGEAARAQFFPPDERPTPEPTVTTTPTPAPVTPAPPPPGRLPVTGLVRMPAESVAVLGLAVIALLAAVAAATRDRKQS